VRVWYLVVIAREIKMTKSDEMNDETFCIVRENPDVVRCS
jgi:hypothetical protein